MADTFSNTLRQTGILSLLMGWGVGEMAYFLIDGNVETWYAYLITFIFIPVVAEIVLGWRILVESPVYLSKRSRENCLTSLNKIAEWNELPVLTLEDIPPLPLEKE